MNNTKRIMLIIFLLFNTSFLFALQEVNVTEDKIEYLIKKVDRLENENTELKSLIEKQKENFEKKLSETRDITKNNLEFYDKSLSMILWLVGIIGAILTLILSGIGISSYLFKKADRKAIDERIDNFRDEAVEKAKEEAAKEFNEKILDIEYNLDIVEAFTKEDEFKKNYKK